jgi:predicted phage gp36 major capsid-like protein
VVYVHNPQRNAIADELRRKADAERAELMRAIEQERATNAALRRKAESERSKSNRLRTAIETERAEVEALRRAAIEDRARMPCAEMSAKVEATILWVERHLPEPRYGGYAGLLAATREIEGHRRGGRNGALMVA